MPSWKRPAFIATITLAPPSIFAFSFWGRNLSFRNLPLALATALGLPIYAWLLTHITIPYLTTPLSHLPAPANPSFLFADGLIFFKQPPGAEFLKLAKTIPNDGLILLRGLFYLGDSLVLTTPAAVKEVLNDKSYDYEKPAQIINFMRHIIGDGLVIVEGQAHKIQRKAVAPAFVGGHIKELVPLFWGKAGQLTSVISGQLTETGEGEKGSAGEVELNKLAARVTLDVIGLACLGRDFNTLENDEDELAKSYATLTNPENGNTFRHFMATSLFGETLTHYLLPKTDRNFHNACATLQRLSRNLLEEKKASRAQKSAEKEGDILSVLMNSPENLTDEDLKNQILTFLAAGSETTSNALTWACYLLSTHPDIQDRLRAQLRSIVGDAKEEDDFDLNAIDANPLLSGVCNETLRLFPAVPVGGRRAVRDTSILGNKVPEGTIVHICPWLINRLPTLWGDDADDFVPERWMGEGAANTGGAASPYSFVTFWHGPRSCIGMGFARTELKYLVSAMVLKFHMEMADKNEVVVPAGPLTLKPKNGLKLRLREL